MPVVCSVGSIARIRYDLRYLCSNLLWPCVRGRSRARCTVSRSNVGHHGQLPQTSEHAPAKVPARCALSRMIFCDSSVHFMLAPCAGTISWPRVRLFAICMWNSCLESPRVSRRSLVRVSRPLSRVVSICSRATRSNHRTLCRCDSYFSSDFAVGASPEAPTQARGARPRGVARPPASRSIALRVTRIGSSVGPRTRRHRDDLRRGPNPKRLSWEGGR